MIGTPQIINPAVLQPAGKIACTIHPGSGRTERIRYKPFRCQIGSSQIPRPRPEPEMYSSPVTPGGTGDSDESSTYNLVFQTGPNGRLVPFIIELGRCRINRCLRRSILVIHFAVQILKRKLKSHRERLTAGYDFETLKLSWTASDNGLPQRRGRLHDGRPVSRIRPMRAARREWYPASRCRASSRRPAAAATSMTEMSNDIVVTDSQRSRSPISIRSRISDSRLASPSNVSRTPLGRPVDPEV